jgi:imidazolonepropionase-like amidohydrolase
MNNQNTYFISNISVVDVERGCLVAGQDVRIAGERIEAVGGHGSLGTGEGAQKIGGEGLYLMPGLVDAHTHYFDPQCFGKAMITNGVTLVRDMGMPNEFIFKLREALRSGEVLGPELVTGGAILDGDPPVIPLISVGVKTPEEGRAAVRRQAELGADFIKVYSCLGKEVFLAILDEAGKLGLKCVGHVPDTIYIEEAAAAGLHSCEHLFGFEKVLGKLLGDPVRLVYEGMGSRIDTFQRMNEIPAGELEAFYGRMAASGMAVCPTVVIYKTGTHFQSFMSGSFAHSEMISEGVLGMWRMMWSGQSDLEDYIWRGWMEMVVGLHQAGVPLMVGTDLMLPGVLPGYAVHEEMAIWQEAGMPAAEVLRGATLTPARVLGLEEHLGSVRAGKTASLALVRGNPLEDVHQAQEIEAVFLKGRYFDRQELEGLKGG